MITKYFSFSLKTIIVLYLNFPPALSTSSCTTFITCYHKYATLLLASYIFVLLFVPELTS